MLAGCPTAPAVEGPHRRQGCPLSALERELEQDYKRAHRIFLIPGRKRRSCGRFCSRRICPPDVTLCWCDLGNLSNYTPIRSLRPSLSPRKRGSIQAVVQREKLVISVQRVRADHKICKNAAETGITMPFAPRSVRLKSTTRSAPDGFVEIPINGDSIVVEECVEECFVPTRTGQQLRKDRGRNDHPPRPSALSKSVVS